MSFDPERIVQAVRAVWGNGIVPLFSTSDWVEEQRTVVEAIKANPLGYEYVERFEQSMAMAVGRKHCVATSTGTAALHLALLTIGVGPGDEVLLPSMTFAGAAAAVRYCGATPHFVDSRYQPFGSINVFKLSRHMSTLDQEQRSRIKALIAVDLLGHCGIDLELEVWCAEYRITLIEDAAAALGSMSLDGFCGGMGKISIVSCNKTKIVTTDGGGALLTNDPDIAQRARHLGTTAKPTSPWFYHHDDVGYNYRLSNICAAFGLAQIERLERIFFAKRNLRARYEEAFSNANEGVLVRGDIGWNCWLNAFCITPAVRSEEFRDQTLKALYDSGIGSRAMFTPLHTLPPYKDCPQMINLKIAEDIYRRTICLPS